MISRSNIISFLLGAAAVLVVLSRDTFRGSPESSTGRRLDCAGVNAAAAATLNASSVGRRRLGGLATRSDFAADCAGAADAAACERTLVESAALGDASVVRLPTRPPESTEHDAVVMLLA